MKKKTWMTGIVLLIVIAMVTGCGVSANQTVETEEIVTYDAAAVADGDYGGLASYDAEQKEAYAEAPAEAPAAEEAEASNDAQSGTGVKTDPEKIIYSANATLETTEFASTVDALEKMVTEAGGYIESSSVNSASYDDIYSSYPRSSSAFYVIRVPQEKLKEMLSELSMLGNVPSTNLFTDNITTQYVDSQARLESYEAQEKRLLELLDMAENVTEIMEIERELSDVRYEIESTQSLLNYWDKSVSYSTLNLDVIEVGNYSPVPGTGFGKRMAEALKRGVEALGDFVLIVLELLPVLILLVLIAVIILVIVRAIRRKNPGMAAKHAEKKAKRAEIRQAKKNARMNKKE